LFSSGFEGATALSGPTGCWGDGCWVDLFGLDSSTGFTWPLNLWGGTTRIQALVGTSVTASTFNNYQINEIQSVTGHDGNPTRALYTEIKQQFPGTFTQNDLFVRPASEQGDLYISYWIKLQPDLAEKLKIGNWRVIWDWKSAGDYRVTAQIVSWGGAAPYWQIRADTYANGGLPPQVFWEIQNKTAPVPIGRWFKFEAFIHRSSGADGRDWMAVDGQVLADHRGPNIGVNAARLNRIMPFLVYTDAPGPAYQWVDDLQVWDGFPPDASGRPHRPGTGTPRSARQ
jgi:hypothetical protein